MSGAELFFLGGLVGYVLGCGATLLWVMSKR